MESDSSDSPDTELYFQEFEQIDNHTETERLRQTQEVFYWLEQHQQAGPGCSFFGQTISIESDELSITEVDITGNTTLSSEDIHNYPNQIDMLLELGHMLYNRTVLQVDLENTVTMWKQIEIEPPTKTQTDS